MLSVDGVSESKSTSISLDVYSMKFKGCREIYPIKIVRPIQKGYIDHQQQFASVISEVKENNLKIESFIADNPKRAFIRNSMQHSSKYACEYCFSCGVPYNSTIPDETSVLLTSLTEQRKQIEIEINNLRKKNITADIESLSAIVENLEKAEKLAKKKKTSSHIVWPADTSNGQPRTKEEILNIVERIEQGIELTFDEKKGIKGRSLLLDIEHFMYIEGLPTEYMHLVCLGVVRRMLELTFSVGESRSRITKRPLTSPEKFNELMKVIKVFKEFSRRARKLDLAVMKAQELRNIVLFYFILITKCLEKNDKEVKLWEMLAFMVRACILPREEFANVNVNHVKYCLKNFYVLFQQLFGAKNCTYSVHVMSSHLLKMIAQGPLTETSAFKFEAFYAELRRAFKPGTVSVVKQMFQSVLLKRKLSKHICEEKTFLRTKDTALECNSLIYLYKNNSHLIYKIQAIDKVNDSLICNQIGNHDVNFEHTSKIDWSSVGVYRKGGMSSENVIVDRNAVAGKVMRVDKYLITCPNAILHEK